MSVGMDSSLPVSERVTRMVVTLLENVRLTDEQVAEIRPLLRAAPTNEPGKMCAEHHPDRPPRWTNYTASKNGRRYSVRVCMECCSARQRKRYRAAVLGIPKAEEHCSHTAADHDDLGYCWHQTNGEPDCDCTSGPRRKA